MYEGGGTGYDVLDLFQSNDGRGLVKRTHERERRRVAKTETKTTSDQRLFFSSNFPPSPPSRNRNLVLIACSLNISSTPNLGRNHQQSFVEKGSSSTPLPPSSSAPLAERKQLGPSLPLLSLNPLPPSLSTLQTLRLYSTLYLTLFISSTRSFIKASELLALRTEREVSLRNSVLVCCFRERAISREE